MARTKEIINGKLTDIAIRNAKPREKRYKLFDGRGLYIEVYPQGGKYWRLKYRMGSKEKRLSIGTYPDSGLQRARQEAIAARDLLGDGRDPSFERRARKAMNAVRAANTFELVAREWMAKKDWADSYRRNIETTFQANLFPRIGAVPVADLDAPMLLTALRPMETRGALELVGRTRRWCSEILRYAVATGRRKDDPAAALKGAFKTRAAQSHPHLERAEIGPFLRHLHDYGGKPETRLAVHLLMLTAVRTGELRSALWSEFDLNTKTWTIPAERMKTRAPHVVPLSRQAVALLQELQIYHRLQPVSVRITWQASKHERKCDQPCDKLGYKGRLVGHGFRATFSTTANESELFSPDVIERALAHKDRNAIRATYNRAKYLQERRRLMQWWADVLDHLQMSRADAMQRKGLRMALVG
ncbi:MAG: integrase arm-type DNA-binding domain-containing protein [Gammaproteobacteria bacterium]